MILTTEILTWSNTLSFNFLKNHKFPRVFIKGIRLPLISLSTSSTSHSINHRLFGRPRLLCNVHFYSNVHYWVIESLSILDFLNFRLRNSIQAIDLTFLTRAELNSKNWTFDFCGFWLFWKEIIPDCFDQRVSDFFL